MRYEKHDDVLDHAGRRRTIKTLGWWCTKCGEGIFTGDALVKHERAFLQLKASADGVLGPREVVKVRSELHPRDVSSSQGDGHRPLTPAQNPFPVQRDESTVATCSAPNGVDRGRHRAC
jgi:hypothetical protein